MTVIFCFSYRPKSARLKGFRRFSLSCGANTVYAPKAGALPPALHLDIFISTFNLISLFSFLLCPPSCGSRNLFGSIMSLDIPTAAPKNARFFCHRQRSRFLPKAGALPPALHLDIFISTFNLISLFSFLLCPPSCGSRNLFGSIMNLDIPTAAPKNVRFFCHRQRSRFLPKAGALPPALHLDTAII